MVPRDTTPTAVKLMASGARSICGCYCRCCRRGCCCCYGCCSEIISRIVSKKTKIKSVVAGRTGKNKTGRSAESGMNTSKKERSISYQNICFLHKKKTAFLHPDSYIYVFRTYANTSEHTDFVYLVSKTETSSEHVYAHRYLVYRFSPGTSTQENCSGVRRVIKVALQ